MWPRWHTCPALSPFPVKGGAALVPGPAPSATAPATEPVALIGRRALQDAARACLAAGEGVLFSGPPGIGRSTLLAAVAAEASATRPGGTTLRCSPAAEDSRLPYVGLIDLFAPVPQDVLDALPGAPRAALRAALLRGPEPADAAHRLAVRMAVLDVLRRLAERGPLLLVVDDLQWLDEPTAAVLAFALRRLDPAAGLDVGFVAAERVADGGQPERLGCCPPATAEITVPPLTADDVARLLRAGTGSAPAAPAVRAIQQAAAGNPFYATELGRAAQRGGPPPEDFPDDAAWLVVPPRLRARVLGRFRALPDPVRHTLLVCATAGRCGLTLLRAAGIADPAADLAEAERFAVAAADAAGRIRFSHPLVAAAVYADAPWHARREAHALLAGVVCEPVERARHLALANPHEDEATAASLSSAAAAARERGTPDAAARLSALAARRTPADRGADRADRWLTAAEHALDAGYGEEAGRIARCVLDSSGSARQRVRARLVLLRTAGQALDGAGALIADGLRDAEGDPELEAGLHQWAAVRGLLCGELESAARHARRAARRATLAGDTRVRISALTVLARARSLTGQTAGAETALEQALALVGEARSGPESWTLLRMRSLLAMDSDRVVEAREHVSRLLGAIEEFAGVEEVVATLVALTRIQVRAGDCAQACGTAARLTLTVAESGVRSAPALYAAALAATFGGTRQEARLLAERAVRASEADGDQLFLLRALAVLGQGALLAGDPAGAADAVEVLRRVKEIGEAMSAADPPLLHWYGDLAEALVMLGETDAAAGVVRQAYERAHDQVPASVLACLERAEGLREAAVGRAKEGAALLLSSADRLRALDLPVDLVRTLIALGAVERRARHRTGARAALAEALQIAERAGAVPLADRAREELTRVDANTHGAGPLLTPTEARIAELVGGGATNREVAAKLFISVKTVEGTLSRIYRKFGVRSRTALALAIAGASGAALSA